MTTDDSGTALLDVTDAKTCRRVMERFRPVGLVNNAGTSFTGAVEDVDDATYQQLWAGKGPSEPPAALPGEPTGKSSRPSGRPPGAPTGPPK